jgi:hypothetical protein
MPYGAHVQFRHAPKADAVRKGVTKRSIISPENVAAVFDDECISKLATKLPRVRPHEEPGASAAPAGPDLNAFGEAIREAARIFARDACMPTANQLRGEIAALYKAADRRLFEQVADLLERLSPQAHELLSRRAKRIGRNNVSAARSPRLTAVGWHGEILTRVSRAPLRLPLPVPGDLRDEASREVACEVLARLCWMGCDFLEGRRRSSGKRSRHIARPLLFAPEPRRNFAKRDAERYFVMLLSLAWQEATRATPSRTARHSDAGRDVGPFARFVRECLCLVGSDADVAGLINEVNRRRREMEQRTGNGQQN